MVRPEQVEVQLKCLRCMDKLIEQIQQTYMEIQKITDGGQLRFGSAVLGNILLARKSAKEAVEFINLSTVEGD